MGMVRTLPAVLAVKGTPTPIYTGTVIAASTFVIKNGIATVTLGSAMPANGYNGPDHGLQASLTPAGGQQVQLWGFTTATYFNGLVVSVSLNNITAKTFSFYFNHADVALTSDAGNTAAIPVERYRAVRLEIGQAAGTDLIYVGDGKVSSSQYMTVLSLAGQLATEIMGDNIPAERIFIDTSGVSSGDVVQPSLIY